MRSRVRSGGRERSTEALMLYLVEWDWGAVNGGGAFPEGLGSMGAVSTGAAAVDATRS